MRAQLFGCYMKFVNQVGLVVEGYSKNRIFELDPERDGFLERFYMLRKRLRESNLECQSADMLEPKNTDILIFHDIMDSLEVILNTIKANPYVKLVYLPNEPNFVIPFHHERVLPKLPVDLILTWNDRIIGHAEHIKQLKIGQPVLNEELIPNISFEEKKFICSIFAYKPSNALGTLFEERISAVEFFDEMPNGIDLFGVGWEQAELPFISSAYKGTCKSKRAVQQYYKFAIAYENIGTLPGLITEKIFDCFSAGVVPIYLGAPNITDYIPKTCFIDMRDFDSYQDLYTYLDTMGKERYQQYLDAVKEFLKTDEYEIFTSDYYAKNIVENVTNLLAVDSQKRQPLSFKLKLIKRMLLYPQVLKNWKRYKRMFLGMIRVW